MKEILEKLNYIYERLQYLQLQPTVSNTTILASCFSTIKEISGKLTKMPDILDVVGKEPESAPVIDVEIPLEES